MTAQVSTNIIKIRFLIYIGLIPFIIALFTLLLSDDTIFNSHTQFTIIVYAALILSFIGAIHWGILLNNIDEQKNWMFVASVIPLILSFISIMVPYQYGLGILFFGFIGIYQYEKNYLWQNFFPEWFQNSRTYMNFSVSGILLLLWLINLNQV